jgi:hypothetical protein
MVDNLMTQNSHKLIHSCGKGLTERARRSLHVLYVLPHTQFVMSFSVYRISFLDGVYAAVVPNPWIQVCHQSRREAFRRTEEGLNGCSKCCWAWGSHKAVPYN